MWYLDKLIVTYKCIYNDLNNILLYDAHFKSVYVILSTFKKYINKLAYLSWCIHHTQFYDFPYTGWFSQNILTYDSDKKHSTSNFWMTCDSVFNLQKKSIRKMAYNERISEDLAQSNRKENDIGKYIFFSDLKEITSIKNVLFLYFAYNFQFVVVTPS